jgi:hypothetical protein
MADRHLYDNLNKCYISRSSCLASVTSMAKKGVGSPKIDIIPRRHESINSISDVCGCVRTVLVLVCKQLV